METPDKNYSISSDHELVDSIMRIPEAIRDEVAELFVKCEKGKPSAKEKVLKLIKRYPRVPLIKQMLATWHRANNQTTAANRVNSELLKSFPDFVIAFNFNVARLLDNENIEELQFIFRESLEIGFHFPTRKVFDKNECAMYMGNMSHYLALCNRFEEAEAWLDNLKEIDDDVDFINEFAETINELKYINRSMSGSFFDDETESGQINLCTLPQREVTLAATSPEFEFLYGKQWQIDIALLQKAIKENKEGLLAELRYIIYTGIEGAEYCYENDEDGWNSAVIHAMLIMPYLNDESTLGDALLLLRQPSRFIDFWIMDWKGDMMNRFYVHFSPSKLQLIIDFLKESPGNTGSKNTLAEFLPQFVIHNPDSRNEIIRAIQELFDYFLAHSDNDELMDTEVIGFIVGAAADLHATELMDTIRDLYAKDYVAEYVGGSLEEVEARLNGVEPIRAFPVYENVFDHLATLKPRTSTAMDYNDDEEFSEYEEIDNDDEKPDFSQILEDMKNYNKVIVNQVTPPFGQNYFSGTSKNALCPCGSGKKYKRCHGL